MTDNITATGQALRAFFTAAVKRRVPFLMLPMLPALAVGYATATYNDLETVRDNVQHRALVGTCVQGNCYEAVVINDDQGNPRYQLLVHAEESPSWPNVAGHYSGYARVETSPQETGRITRMLSDQLNNATDKHANSQDLKSVMMSRVGKAVAAHSENGTVVERSIEEWTSPYNEARIKAAGKNWSDFGTMIARQDNPVQISSLPDKPYGPLASSAQAAAGTLIGVYLLYALGVGGGPAFHAYKKEVRRQKDGLVP